MPARRWRQAVDIVALWSWSQKHIKMPALMLSMLRGAELMLLKMALHGLLTIHQSASRREPKSADSSATGLASPSHTK